MKKLFHKNRLAVLAVQKECIKVLVANGSPQTGKILSFSVDTVSGWNNPEALGQAFNAFLKQHSISCNNVEKLTLPADWTAVRTFTLPVLENESVLPDLVRTSAEEMFAYRIEDLAIGYESSVTGDATHITVVSLLRSRLEKLQSFLRSAGLTASAILPYSALLVQIAVLAQSKANVVVARNGDTIEVAGISNGRLMWLRVIENYSEMSIELRRAVMSEVSDTENRVVVIGSNELADEVGRALNCKPTVCETTDNDNLSLLVVADVQPTLNLLEKRKPLRLFRPMLRRVALAGILVLCLLTWGFIEWRGVIDRIDVAQGKICLLQSDADAAEQLQKQLRLTASWRSNRAESLDALHDLTELFPQEATIWLRSFKRDDEGCIDIVGWARNRHAIQDLQEALEKSPHFINIKSGAVRDSGKNKTLSFSVECMHVKGKVK